MKTNTLSVRIVAFVLLFAMAFLTSCTFRPSNDVVTTGPETTVPSTTEPKTTEPVTTEPQTTESHTTEPHTTEPQTTEPATTEPIVEPEFAYLNPLTGEGTNTDTNGKRPLAVVIANYYLSSSNQTEPQANLSKADIIYEYPVEGNVTRLLAIYSDYASLGEVGALRSARYYDIQLALGYNAIFASAGGSDLYKISDALLKCGAYYYFNNHLVDYLDFTNDTTILDLKLAQRDYLKKLGAGTTNSLSVSGADFTQAIEAKEYSTNLSSAFDYSHVMKFATQPVMYAKTARSISFNVSNTRQVDFIYNGNDGTYLRYQFDDKDGNLAHVDSANDNVQLSFSNVIVMYTNVKAIAEDAKSTGTDGASDRKYVDVVGSGTGYYMTSGTVCDILWKKESENAPIKFTYVNGQEVEFNTGKTFISICPNSYKSGIEIK